MKVSSTALLPCLLMACAIMTSHASDQPALKDVFKDDFLVGVAVNDTLVFSPDAPQCEVAIVKKQFNSISPENVLKWEAVQPAPHRYNFAPGDRYVDFGRKNGMFVVGHNLVWHSQTPDWVFRDEEGNLVGRDVLLQRMHDHISTVVKHYRGRIDGWDVVNEALNEDGTLRDSQWLKIIGEDYLVKAYQFAHEADPNVQLYYNDFSLENAPKRGGAIALIKKLQAAGVRIAGVGMQGHYKMDWPTPQQLDESIQEFSALGVKVMITELDVDLLPAVTQSDAAEVSLKFRLSPEMNPYASGLPDVMQQALANRYADLFQVLVKHRGEVSRITFWGVTDADSWLNNWPVAGRTSYPMLFGRDCAPKPAFDAVIAVGRGQTP
jgi:endo-1,4-beta-xylanase